MTYKNNLQSFHIKDVARLIASEWGIEFKDVKNDASFVTWFDIGPSSPLATHLKDFTVHIHYSTIDSLHETRMVWSRVVRTSQKEAKRPVLIWRTERYPWQVATLARSHSLKGEIPLSWAHTVRRDLSLWCAEIQEEAFKSLKG